MITLTDAATRADRNARLWDYVSGPHGLTTAPRDLPRVTNTLTGEVMALVGTHGPVAWVRPLGVRRAADTVQVPLHRLSVITR